MIKIFPSIYFKIKNTLDKQLPFIIKRSLYLEESNKVFLFLFPKIFANSAFYNEPLSAQQRTGNLKYLHFCKRKM